MPRWRRWIDSEEGTASLEFVTAGMILLVPLVYLVLTMTSIQTGAMAVEAAARQAARVYVQSANSWQAQARAERAIDYALSDYGLDASKADVAISCSPRPHNCLSRLGHVTVTVGVSVALPLVPPALTLNVPLSVPMTAAATDRVSRFWGTP